MFEDYYRQIGEPLYQELLQLLDDHEQIALLGPRNGAKAYVLFRLAELARLMPERRRPIVARLLWSDHANNSPEEFVKGVAAELQLEDVDAALPDTRLSGRISNMLHSAVRKHRRPVWVFVQDIVGFPRPIARQMLEALREAHYNDELKFHVSVIVTGSADFVPLTMGPNSPYRDARSIVLAGFDFSSALEFFLDRQSRLSPDNTLPPIDAEAFRVIYDQTQGSAHFLQEILGVTVRHPYHFTELEKIKQWSPARAADCLQHYERTFLADDYFCRQMLREIEYQPEAFELLLRVTREGDGTVRIDAHNRPHLLEVCGMITCDQMGLCRISSPILRRFVECALSPRHVADVYAGLGKWTSAWQYYDALPAGYRERPVSGPARFQWRQVVLDWEAYLQDQAYSGPSSVAVHFINGLHHLYGFDAGGVLDLESGEALHGAIYPKGKAVHLPSPNHDDLVWYEPLDRKAQWKYWISADRSNLWSQCIFDDGFGGADGVVVHARRDEAGREIDHSELKLLLESIDKFWRAFGNARDIQYRNSIGALRERHLKVMEAVSAAMITEPFDMRRVVEKTAEALVHIAGYYRVQICLVNARGDRIQSVASCCHDPDNDFFAKTDFPLTDPDSDVQAWVVVHRELKVIRDAKSALQMNPRVQREQAVLINMRGFAVVPMEVNGSVVGTLHFEVHGGGAPGFEEQNLFKILASQAGGIFHRAQRMVLLQGSLDALNDQVRIVDPRMRVAYVNPRAAKYMPDEHLPGWQGGNEDYDLEGLFPWAEALPDISGLPALTTRDALRYFLTDRDEPGLRGKRDRNPVALDWFLAPIDDFRSRLSGSFKADGRIGYVERVHSISGLFLVLNNLTTWLHAENATETAKSIVDTSKRNNYPWCRIYLYRRDADKREMLQSYAETGLKDPENRRRFLAGKVTDYANEMPLPQSWHCLRTVKGPAIYEQDDDLEPETVVPAPKEDGLPRYRCNYHKYRETLERKSTSVWIDAPLTVRGRELGIVSMGLPARQLRPENWALLKLTVQCAALALDDAIRAEDRVQTEQWKRTVETTGWIFHRLRTPLSTVRLNVMSLRRQLARGRLTTESVAEPLALIDGELERMERISAEYMRHIRHYVPTMEVSDLVQTIRSMCKASGNAHPEMQVQFDSPFDALPVDTDAEAVGDCVDEMIHNASKAGATHVKVVLERSANGREVLIRILDDGSGIPIELRGHRLFEPDPRKSQTGTGLGLANIKDTLTALRGRIRLLSGVARKTEFLISLPTTSRKR